MSKTAFLTLMLLISSVSFADTVTQTWVRGYNNTSNLDDMVFDMAVDSSGNVYVAGISNTSNGTCDITLVKYNSAGTRLWYKQYDSGLDRNDFAKAITIDPSGNIYVAGQSDLVAGSTDCRLLKYNSAGNLQWAENYRAAGNTGTHYFNDVVTDSAGNAYVAGICTIAATGQDYITAKYNSSGGNPVWVKTLNSSGSTYDCAMEIALDSSNNVYAAGTCGIIKYKGSTGGKMWITAPGTDYHKIAIDASGNIYSYNAISPLTVVKYNSSGEKQWESTYTSGNNTVFPTDIAVDPCGNCLVCGIFSTTATAIVKFSSTGELLWNSIHPITDTSISLPAMACDQWGNTYLTIVYNSNLMTYKNDVDGEEKWNMVYAGNFTSNVLPTIFIRSGEVYAAGSGTVSGQAINFFTLQYNQQFCTAYYPSDMNKDCNVDFLDFAEMAQFWAECNKYPSSECN